MIKRPYRVLIIYKSGAQIEFQCSEFSIKNNVYRWADARPNPLLLGVDEIAAVYDMTDVKRGGWFS